MAKYKKEDLINSIVDLKINKGISTKTIIKDILQDQLGFKQTYAYELYKEARKKIAETYQANNEEAINVAVGQLESLYESAMKDKNKKLALEILKEINKLCGLYAADKVDITVTEYKAKFGE